MEISIIQMILIFIVACITGIGSVLDEFQTHRPLIACTLIGLILGDITSGIILGGALELIALGWMNVGAAMAPDTALASIVSTILAIAGHRSPAEAISLAIPIAAAGQILTVLIRTTTVGFQHEGDRAANEGDFNKIDIIHVSALALQALRIAIPSVFVAYSVGTDVVQDFFESIPKVVTDGLNIAGGMIAIVGYAMVVNMMRAGYLMPFFYLGFVVAAFTEFNLVALGIIGTVGAILYIQLNPKYQQKTVVSNKNENDNQLDNMLD